MSDFFDKFETENPLLCRLEQIKLEKEEMLYADDCPVMWVKTPVDAYVTTIGGLRTTWKAAADYLINQQPYF